MSSWFTIPALESMTLFCVIWVGFMITGLLGFMLGKSTKSGNRVTIFIPDRDETKMKMWRSEE